MKATVTYALISVKNGTRKRANLDFFCKNCSIFLQQFENVTKIFKFLNQCFAQFDVGKSVLNAQKLLARSTAILLETLLLDQSSAKHWFKHFSASEIKEKTQPNL